VVARQSTDVLAVEDREVAGALRYIREQGCRGLNVNELLKTMPISRSTLDRRMRLTIGRTAKAEITRVQLERAKALLARTSLPLEAVAMGAGFANSQRLCEAFKRTAGETPGAYRRARHG
jgi:LacI family transcriptional regulator